MRLVDALQAPRAHQSVGGRGCFCHSDRSGGIWGFLAEDVRLSRGAGCGCGEDRVGSIWAVDAGRSGLDSSATVGMTRGLRGGNDVGVFVRVVGSGRLGLDSSALRRTQDVLRSV